MLEFLCNTTRIVDEELCCHASVVDNLLLPSEEVRDAINAHLKQFLKVVCVLLEVLLRVLEQFKLGCSSFDVVAIRITVLKCTSDDG